MENPSDEQTADLDVLRVEALDQAVKLNIKRGEIVAPFPTGKEVVIDAEAMLRFLRGQEPVKDSDVAPHLIDGGKA